ncbi:MAG TPA: formyltransferase family protein [Burkholderiales bacterium]|nr:formyltransferase family protein [Burkholderiales bacterium]
MRIAFLVNRDIESLVALNLLLPGLARHELSVFVSDRVGNPQSAKPAAMLGQLAFVEQDLWNRVVFPHLDAAPGEARLLSFEGIRRRMQIPVRPLGSARTPEALGALAATGAELFVSIRFGKILGAEAIGIPRLGVLNLHSGILPDYRGVLATFRALMNGDSKIGCTLHRIDSPGIDTGPVIEISTAEARPDRSLFWHVLALYPLGAAMIQRAVDLLAAGKDVPGTPQPAGRGAYFSFPTDEDLVRFTAAGWRLFDRSDLDELLGAFGVPDAPQDA